MNNDYRILLVDDEPSVLDGLRRKHRKSYDLTTAVGGADGIAVFQAEGPFDVVISDYQMPEMNGARFLGKIAELDPDCMRMMLTGNADLQAAINAVNEGNVFRFMTKPCAPALFVQCVDAALEQRRLRQAEKSLLEDTLKGSLAMMSEVLGLCDPAAFGRAERVRTYAVQLGKALGVPESWRIESAAMMSQLGCIALPADLLEAAACGAPLDDEQAAAYAKHPEVAARLIGEVPRLGEVATMVRYQGGVPTGGDREALSDDVLQGCQVLAACVDFDQRIAQGATKAQAVRAMLDGDAGYSVEVLKALVKVEPIGTTAVARSVMIAELRPGMIIGEDVWSENGTLVVADGNVVSRSLLERMTNYHQLRGLKQPIRVMVPGGESLERAA